jgi:hypothetical protein
MLMLRFPAVRSPAERIGVNPDPPSSTGVRVRSSEMRTAVDLDDERADERDVAVVHGWLQDMVST